MSSQKMFTCQVLVSCMPHCSQDEYECLVESQDETYLTSYMIPSDDFAYEVITPAPQFVVMEFVEQLFSRSSVTLQWVIQLQRRSS